MEPQRSRGFHTEDFTEFDVIMYQQSARFDLNASCDGLAPRCNWTSPDMPLQLPTFSTAAKVRVIITFILCGISTFCNLAVLWAANGHKRKSHVRVLIINLTVADLLVTFIVMPVDAVWNITVQWLAGDMACRFLMFLKLQAMYSCAFVTVVISLDRQSAILNPLAISMARKRNRVMLMVAWTMSALFSVPQMFIFHNVTITYPANFTQCTTRGSFVTHWQETAYNMFTFSCLFLLPLVIMIVCYTRIFIQISKRMTKKSLSSNEPHLRCSKNNIPKARMRTLKMSIVIVICFIVCWTPYYLLGLWYWFFPDDLEGKVSHSLTHILFIFGLFNACLDPIIYGLFTIRFRKGLRSCTHKATELSDKPIGHALPLADLDVGIGDGGDGVPPVDGEGCSPIVHDGGVVVGSVEVVGGLLVEVVGHLLVDVFPVDPDVLVTVAPGLLVLEAQSVVDLVLDDAVVQAALPVEREHLSASFSAQSGETSSSVLDADVVVLVLTRNEADAGPAVVSFQQDLIGAIVGSENPGGDVDGIFFCIPFLLEKKSLREAEQEQQQQADRGSHLQVGHALPLADLDVGIGDGGDGVPPVDGEGSSPIVHDGGVVVGSVEVVGGLLVEVVGHLLVDVLPVDPDVLVTVAPGLLVLEAQSVVDLVLDDAVVQAALPVEREHLSASFSAQSGETSSSVLDTDVVVLVLTGDEADAGPAVVSFQQDLIGAIVGSENPGGDVDGVFFCIPFLLERKSLREAEQEQQQQADRGRHLQ
ncbi:hypothetical protein INR49_032978, partial [Caranx melampygus]